MKCLGAQRFAAAWNLRFVLAAACLLACACPAQASGSLNYNINFYVISAGGDTLTGSCFRVSGTAGEAAPGYSSGGLYSLISGYWQPAATATRDEIFFSGFEGCSI